MDCHASLCAAFFIDGVFDTVGLSLCDLYDSLIQQAVPAI